VDGNDRHADESIGSNALAKNEDDDAKYRQLTTLVLAVRSCALIDLEANSRLANLKPLSNQFHV